jgi:hypothetical protein
MRLRTVAIVGVLLVLQAALLVGAVVYKIFGLAVILQQVAPDELAKLPEAAEAGTVLGFFVPLAIMCILAAISFFFRLRAGWLLAISTQGLCLFAALLLRLQFQWGLLYPAIMAVCIVIVLYLNSSEVRTAFRVT